MVRVRFPAAAPILSGCASARGRVSKTQLTPGGTEAACHFHLGSWQTSNALALQASLCGSVTHRLHQPLLEAQQERGCRAEAKRRRAIAPADASGYGPASQFQLRETRPMHR